MRYRYFLWDFDGTLFDTYPAIVRAFQHALGEFGREAGGEEIYLKMMDTIPQAVRHYTERFELGPAFGQRFKRLQRPYETAMAAPFPGARAFCQRVVEAGGKNYLYTHRNAEAILYLKRYGLDLYFEDYVTSEDGFPPKPAPDAVAFLLNRHQLDPGQSVMIGDRRIDILAGKNAGIGGGYFDPLERGGVPEADFSVRSMEELTRWLLPAEGASR